MGLAEKRWIAQFQTEELPKYQERLDKAVGAKLPLEIAWDSFDVMTALEYFEHQGLAYVAEAFELMCRDQIGKDAVKDAIKKISIKNVKSAADRKVVVKNKVVEIAGAWGDRSGETIGADDIRKTVEAAL
jgi:hypothetical protein